MSSAINDSCVALCTGFVPAFHKVGGDDLALIVVISAAQIVAGTKLIAAARNVGCLQKVPSLRRCMKWTALACGAAFAIQLVHSAGILVWGKGEADEKLEWANTLSVISGLLFRISLLGLTAISLWKYGRGSLPWDHRLQTLGLATWLGPAVLAITVRGFLDIKQHLTSQQSTG